MPLQVELLEKSFNNIKPYGNLFVSNFYENLFKADPETKSLFANVDPETKKNQLWRDLVLVMENLRQPERLKNILHGLGARLFTDGILPEHYTLIKNSFFSSFERFLGGEWTTDLKQAWDDAYIDFRDLMFEGAEKTSRQMGYTNILTQSPENLEEKVEAVASSDDSLVEESLPTPIVEVEEQIVEVPEITNTEDYAIAEPVETPVAQSPENLEEKVGAITNTEDSLVEESLPTPIIEVEEQIEKVPAITNTEDFAIAERLETPVAEVEETIEGVPAITNPEDSAIAEPLETPVAQSPDNLEEKVEAIASTEDSLIEEFLETPIVEVEESIEEVPAITNPEDSLFEESLPTPIVEVEDQIEEVPTITNTEYFAIAERLETPVAEVEETIEEVPTITNTEYFAIAEPVETFVEQSPDNLEEKVEAVASSEDSLTEEVFETPLTKSATIMEERVIIEDINLSLEQPTLRTTMPESDQNIPQNDTIKNRDDIPLAENTLDHPLEDLSDKLKSETIDPHFTQIFIPESQTESATTPGATATAVKEVASEKSYQPEIQTSQSNKGLLIGGGVAGAIGLLLLLLL